MGIFGGVHRLPYIVPAVQDGVPMKEKTTRIIIWVICGFNIILNLYSKDMVAAIAWAVAIITYYTGRDVEK